MSHCQQKLPVTLLSNQKWNWTFRSHVFFFLTITWTIFSKIHNHMRNVKKKSSQSCGGLFICVFGMNMKVVLFWFFMRSAKSWETMSPFFANVETSDIYFTCFCRVNKRKAAKGYGCRFSNCRHPGRAVCSIIPQWMWGSDVYIKSSSDRGVRDQEKIVRMVQLNTRTW